MSRTEKRPRLRCAVYTRKSSEEGLEQGFNSLHAQRDACEAYVLSQAGEGWTLLKEVYDDGGFSGGSMERPALHRLLADIACGKIDIVVVYKVDRLTRSLTDFARIVEAFDHNGVSFVSVTQAFNTTTSMGRLTLNVLLSFAQFEREVTGERIRDKIAASKRKGMWMGGIPPLGYDPPQDLTTRALVVNRAEAETVRRIFDRYIELGSVHALERWLAAEDIRSKAWTTKSGRPLGGLPFSRGALFHLLKNRIYVGEIVHKTQAHPGAHPAIVEEDVFAEVQRQLASKARRYKERPTRVATMPLKGRIFDADGSPMSPAFSHKPSGKLYRYYVSAPLQQGRRASSDAIARVPAAAIEDLVGAALKRMAPSGSFSEPAGPALARVEVHPTTVQFLIRRADLFSRLGELEAELQILSQRLEPGWRVTAEAADPSSVRLTIPIRMKRGGARIWIAGADGQSIAPRAADQSLAGALKQAHGLVRRKGVVSGAASEVAFASTYERRLMQLAFLAPDLQLAILEGRQPVGMALQNLIKADIPPAWEDQRRMFARVAEEA